MSRYIDADNLPRHGNRGGLVYWRDIEAQPTADVRENVRGEWIKGKDSLWTLATCSVCGELSVEGGKPFCPNCGADMRGDKENAERI